MEGYFVDSQMEGFGRVVGQDSWYLGYYSKGQRNG